ERRFVRIDSNVGRGELRTNQCDYCEEQEPLRPFHGEPPRQNITPPQWVEGSDCMRHWHLPSENGIPNPSGSVRLPHLHWAGSPMRQGRVRNLNRDFDSGKARCSSGGQACRGIEEARTAVPEIRKGK